MDYVKVYKDAFRILANENQKGMFKKFTLFYNQYYKKVSKETMFLGW